MQEELKTLNLLRGQLKTRLTKFDIYFQGLNNGSNIKQLKMRLEKFQPTWQEFETIQSKIELIDQSDKQVDERDAFENAYFKLMSEIDDFMTANSPSSEAVSNPPSVNNSVNYSDDLAQIKLPSLNLPIFDGKYENWLTFHETFTSLIHDNDRLSPIQKFHYLKSCLKNEAANLVESLGISSENYTVAWDLLNSRFTNKRLIIKNHLNALFGLPNIVKGSSASLRQLLDNTVLHLKLLKNLNLPVEQWDVMIIHIVSAKFDPITIREWEAFTNNDVPTFQEMTAFLNKRCQFLEALEHNKISNKLFYSNKADYNNVRTNINKSTAHVVTNQSSCPLCKQNHYINQCRDFLKLNIEERINKVKQLKLCSNCLRNNHSTSKCRSANTCKNCQKKHNTLLHINIETSNQQKGSSDQVCTNAVNISIKGHQVLLSTAVVHVLDSQGKVQECRALLDAGSQSNFISESAYKRLALKSNMANVHISGINQSNHKATQGVDIRLKSRLNSFKSDINCLILPKITANLPLVSFDTTQLNLPNNIKLADPRFNVSAPIDILIGAELFYDLMCIGQIKLGKYQPTLQKTHFGWVVGGNITAGQTPKQTICNLATDNSNLENQVIKFWQIEDYSNKSKQFTKQELACEKHFADNYKRNDKGRFIVKLPFKADIQELGNSRYQAIKRFKSLENKLQKNPELKQQYSKFINDYLELGHMELVCNDDKNINPSTIYYIPHHGVFKPSSTTTKLRVVFDGSAKTSSGISLNDNLMIGPTIQQDLFSILTRFRTHKYALTADITKMYRQILIDVPDRDYQRIIWRNNPTEPLQTFRLNTVSYGTAAASFLAIRSLQQLAEDERDEFPLAHEIIIRDFYVDDVLTGSNDLNEAREIQNQLISALARGGFELAKWASNCDKLITNSSLPHLKIVNLDKQDDTKVLGIVWKSNCDKIKYSSINFNSTRTPTKRTILSTIAQLFDPLGLIGPILITGKIILQRLWSLKLDWDESVPIDVHTLWVEFINQMPLLNKLEIERKIIPELPVKFFEIHGFSDASQEAYGACVYLRSCDTSGNYIVKLICAKSRVAPLKCISIPRLELCGALLLAQLIDKIKQVINLPIINYFCWTDSSVVLAWLAGASNSWKTFVSNRVAEIQSLTDTTNWSYIKTKQNPADIISRGTSAANLIQSQLWWEGPSWLSTDKSKWPQINSLTEKGDIPEKRVVASLATKLPTIPVISKFSSYQKLQRVIAYCLRFIQNCRKPKIIQTGPINVSELNHASISILKYIQTREFPNEIKHLNANKQVPKNSSLLSLNPFIDEQGLIRVGGRLKNASLSYDVKHPIVLPKKHHVTKLLIRDTHGKQLHAGQQATLAALRQQFWPISGRDAVRQVLHDCIRCYRAKPKTGIQMMGDLPLQRTTPNRPFINCGVDFAGPIFLREGRGRRKKSVKAYMSLFICFATKAVHLELVSDLSADAFLNALKRFISRRGNVSNIYSDNATNFVGAQKQLHELETLFKNSEFQSKLNIETTSSKITWHFIPPRAPHFGGLWEAGIKNVKFHLKRVIGDTLFTYEEMYTLLTRIEACINSRPLTPCSNDPNDLAALTPSHFLIGDLLTAPVEPNLTDIKLNRLSRWQHLEQLRQHFWKRWYKEYLTQLQQRTKWQQNNDLKFPIGTLVLIREDNLPPLKWQLGRIIDTTPGHDNIVRVVTIKTMNGTVQRPITKICVLPCNKGDSESES